MEFFTRCVAKLGKQSEKQGKPSLALSERYIKNNVFMEHLPFKQTEVAACGKDLLSTRLILPLKLHLSKWDADVISWKENQM